MTQLIRELPPGFLLKHGSHSSFDEGACMMEAVAYVAGEPHSAEPKCASSILTRIAIRLNDRYDDDDRQLLAPLIPRLVGTRSTREVDRKRSLAMVDASVREIVPLGLDAVKWHDLATRLRELAPIVDTASARAANVIAVSVRDEARKRRYTAAYADAADAAYAAYAYAAYAAYADAAAYAAYAAYAYADAAAYAAYAAYAYAAYAAYADAADAAYADAADAADAAYAACAYAYAAYAAAADAPERARIRSQARRPIVEASVRAFERAIAITGDL